jgi:hypothetical protein
MTSCPVAADSSIASDRVVTEVVGVVDVVVSDGPTEVKRGEGVVTVS